MKVYNNILKEKTWSRGQTQLSEQKRTVKKKINPDS